MLRGWLCRRSQLIVSQPQRRSSSHACPASASLAPPLYRISLSPRNSLAQPQGSTPRPNPHPAGQLAQSVSHSYADTSTSEESAWNIVTNQELVNRLVPVAPQSIDEAAINMRIDLRSEHTMITGDQVDATLALDVPTSLAEQLGLGKLHMGFERVDRCIVQVKVGGRCGRARRTTQAGVPPSSLSRPAPAMTCILVDIGSGGGPVDADTSNSTASSSGDGGSRRVRRRLTAEQYRARRMILDFHGTRRTLTEFNDLTSVLSQLGVQNQVPKAVVTGKAKKNGGAKVREHAI